MSIHAPSRFVAVPPPGMGPPQRGVVPNAVPDALPDAGSGGLTDAAMSAPAAGRRDLPEFGVLAPLLEDSAVTDVFVNGSGQVWVDRGDGAVQESPLPLAEPELRELAV
jgi:pilus assembly protein CpaF